MKFKVLFSRLAMANTKITTRKSEEICPVCFLMKLMGNKSGVMTWDGPEICHKDVVDQKIHKRPGVKILGGGKCCFLSPSTCELY